MPKIRFKRGLEEKLPLLSEGEPGFTTDTEKLFIGASEGNVEFAKKKDVDINTSKIAEHTSTLENLSHVDANAEMLEARGTYPVLGDRLDDVTTQLAQNTNYVSIKKYNNDLYVALENEDFVFIPEGQFITRPIPNTLLKGKSIKGTGKKSILYFEGDVKCFDITGQHTVLSDFTILVDSINTQDVIHVTDRETRIFDVKIENLDIALFENFGVYVGYSDQVQGLYSGIRFLSIHSGLYRCTVKGINIDMPKNGVIVAEEGDTAWATHNTFDDIYIFGYSTMGFGFLETSSILLNTVTNLRLEDTSKSTIERIGLNISGFGNVFNNVQMFKDQIVAKSYTINFDVAAKRCEKNFVNGGHLEGYIKNEHLMKDNYVLFTNTKKQGQTFYTQPYQNYLSSVNNILDNSTFDYGIGKWVANGTTSILTNTDKSKVSKNHLSVVGTGTLNIKYDLPTKDILKGKTITFTACVKSTSPDLYVVIDEGGTVGYERGAYHTGDGDFEVLTVTKKIDGSGSMVRLQVLDGGSTTDKTFEVAWVNLSYGIFSPLHPLAEKPFYQHKNKGTATIEIGQTSVVVNHNLGITPKTEDIQVTGDYFYGTSACKKYWVTSINATSFTIDVDVDPQTSKAQFGWKVNTQ